MRLALLRSPINWSIAILIVGLAVDQLAQPWGQPLVNVWVWCCFAWLVARASPAERVSYIACLLIASAGEVFCSLIWGLYDYRLHNIPFFVPPGHVLLYALGLHFAPRIPERWLVPVAPIVAITALALGLSGRDLLSIPLAAIFVLFTRYGSGGKLYPTMFGLATLLELWGTWVGNWAWRPLVPWLDWSTLNPPFAAGAFYCGLDWMVARFTRAWQARRAPAAQA